VSAPVRVTGIHPAEARVVRTTVTMHRPGSADTAARVILVPTCRSRYCVPTQAWRTNVTYVIALPCVDVLDRACVEECPVDCIYEGGRMLYIHPDECVDCGACEPVCPVEAIFYEDDVPAEWADYTRANVDFFDDLGSPGGASKVGKINKDDPLVAALPPMGEEN
jgi:NAD-dependent dihydropyrimidine dehydrogenase PreA subunit